MKLKAMKDAVVIVLVHNILERVDDATLDNPLPFLAFAGL